MTVQVPTEIQNSVNTLWQAARPYLTGRPGLIVFATVALLAGLALGWNWLVAAGIAPILIAMLPCLAMCALGLCMHRGGEQSCSAENAPSKRLDTTVDATLPAQSVEIQPDRPSGRPLPREGE
jgi:hypothetical protein